MADPRADDWPDVFHQYGPHRLDPRANVGQLVGQPLGLNDRYQADGSLGDARPDLRNIPPHSILVAILDDLADGGAGELKRLDYVLAAPVLLRRVPLRPSLGLGVPEGVVCGQHHLCQVEGTQLIVEHVCVDRHRPALGLGHDQGVPLGLRWNVFILAPQRLGDVLQRCDLRFVRVFPREIEVHHASLEIAGGCTGRR